MNISIIGYGHMGKALCRGLLTNPTYHLRVAAPSLTPGQVQPRLHTHSSNLAILPEAQILILAVKPAQMAAVLAEIHTHIPLECLIISLAAGLDMAWFASHLAPDSPLVRAIPNLAAACGQSATPLIQNPWVTVEQHHLVTALFRQCGLVTWITDEALLDTLTALSGSGLAYIFLLIQTMRDAAITLGLDADIANTFAIQTLAGASSLAAPLEPSLSALQQQVTSKAGTTAAALDVFSHHHLEQIVLAAMQAAVARSQTLRTEQRG